MDLNDYRSIPITYRNVNNPTNNAQPAQILPNYATATSYALPDSSFFYDYPYLNALRQINQSKSSNERLYSHPLYRVAHQPQQTHQLTGATKLNKMNSPPYLPNYFNRQQQSSSNVLNEKGINSNKQKPTKHSHLAQTTLLTDDLLSKSQKTKKSSKLDKSSSARGPNSTTNTTKPFLDYYDSEEDEYYYNPELAGLDLLDQQQQAEKQQRKQHNKLTAHSNFISNNNNNNLTKKSVPNEINQDKKLKFSSASFTFSKSAHSNPFKSSSNYFDYVVSTNNDNYKQLLLDADENNPTTNTNNNQDENKHSADSNENSDPNNLKLPHLVPRDDHHSFKSFESPTSLPLNLRSKSNERNLNRSELNAYSDGRQTEMRNANPLKIPNIHEYLYMMSKKEEDRQGKSSSFFSLSFFNSF
jgi:hypothetical protein